jgi:hypothetical protein
VDPTGYLALICGMIHRARIDVAKHNCEEAAAWLNDIAPHLLEDLCGGEAEYWRGLMETSGRKKLHVASRSR